MADTMDSDKEKLLLKPSDNSKDYATFGDASNNVVVHQNQPYAPDNKPTDNAIVTCIITDGPDFYFEHNVPDTQRTPREKSPYQQLAACALLLLALLAVAGGSAAAQVLGGAIPELELNAWRFGLQLILLVPISAGRKCDLKVPRNKLLLLVGNIILINALNIFLFNTYIYLPVGVADGLMNSIIISGNALLSICIKSERKLVLYIAYFLCLIGIVLLTQPPIMFHNGLPPTTNWTAPCVTVAQFWNDPNLNFSIPNTNNTTEDGPGVTNGLRSEYIGYIYAIVGALIAIARLHAISHLVRTVNPFTFAFWNALIGTCVSLLLAGLVETLTIPHSGFCVIMLLVHCLGTAMISVGNPWVLQYISPTLCAMLNACKMVMMLVMQYTILKEIKPGRQNWLEIFGAVLCFSCTIGGPLAQILSRAKLFRKQ